MGCQTISARAICLVLVLCVSIGGVASKDEVLKMNKKYIGMWTGRTGSRRGDSWTLILAMFGGSGEDPVALLSLRESSYECVQRLKIHAPDKKDKKPEYGELEGVLELDTESKAGEWCWEGSFKIRTLSSDDQGLLEVQWLDDKGNVDDNWSVIMTRTSKGASEQGCPDRPSPVQRLKNAVKASGPARG